MKNFIILLALSAALSSCTFIIKKYYGIKILKNFDEDDQNIYLKKIGFSEIESFSFDSTKYDLIFSKKLSLDNEKYYDSTFSMPQLRVFDRSGKQTVAWQQCRGVQLLDSILITYPPKKINGLNI